jgi:hypothetical protein
MDVEMSDGATMEAALYILPLRAIKTALSSSTGAFPGIGIYTMFHLGSVAGLAPEAAQ